MRENNDHKQPLYVMALLILALGCMWVPQEPIHQPVPPSVEQQLNLWMDETQFPEECREAMEWLVILDEDQKGTCNRLTRKALPVFAEWRTNNFRG